MMAVEYLGLNGRYLHAANRKPNEKNCQNKLNKQLLSFSVAYNDYMIPEVFLSGQKSCPYLTLFRSKHNVFCARNHCILSGLGKDPSQKKKPKQPPSCPCIVHSVSKVTHASGENWQKRFIKVLKLRIWKNMSWEWSKNPNEFFFPCPQLAAFPILA